MFILISGLCSKLPIFSDQLSHIMVNRDYLEQIWDAKQSTCQRIEITFTMCI